MKQINYKKLILPNIPYAGKKPIRSRAFNMSILLSVGMSL